MNTLNKLVIVFGSIIVGMTLFAIIDSQVTELKFDQVEYTYQTTLGYVNVDNVEATYDSLFDIGRIGSIEHSSQGSNLIIGQTIPPYSILYEYINGVYEEVIDGVPDTGAGIGVKSVDISKDGNFLAYGLNNNTGSSTKVYRKDNGSWIEIFNEYSANFTDSTFAVKFFGPNDEYFINGGDSIYNDDLRIFKYNSNTDYFDTINIESTGTVDILDIDIFENYIIEVRKDIGFIDFIIYDFENNTYIHDSLSISISGNTDVDWSNNGEFIAFAGNYSTPYIYKFDKENETFSPVNINNVPAGFTSLYTANFIGDNYVYFGGNAGSMKFEYNEITSQFDNVDTDLTTYLSVIDTIEPILGTKTMLVTDARGLMVYDLDFIRLDEVISLPVEPYEIISVIQNGNEKEFTLNGSDITILSPSSDTDVDITYTVLEEVDTLPIINLFPILAVTIIVGSLVLVIAVKMK